MNGFDAGTGGHPQRSIAILDKCGVTLTAEERELQQQLEQELTISSAAARMLVVRGIRTADEARAFVRPSLDQLHDPFLMKDMRTAVDRLNNALGRKDKI
mgnify:CR=1 FL=1